jgi:hypothetical protein
MGHGSRVLALGAAVCAIASAGCNQHLLGTRDVRLEYEVPEAATQEPKTTLEHVRHAVSQRLAAAQISADVEATEPNLVQVTVDELSADSVDEFLAWRGGLRVYRVDPAFSFSPDWSHGLTLKTAVLADGRVEQYFVGATDDVFRAVRASKV